MDSLLFFLQFCYRLLIRMSVSFLMVAEAELSSVKKQKCYPWSIKRKNRLSYPWFQSSRLDLGSTCFYRCLQSDKFVINRERTSTCFILRLTCKTLLLQANIDNPVNSVPAAFILIFSWKFWLRFFYLWLFLNFFLNHSKIKANKKKQIFFLVFARLTHGN